MSESDNPFDPSRMAIGWQGLTGRPIPRHGPLDTFLRGPIPWPWWSRAASLPGRALHVASAVRYLVGWKRGPVVSLALGDLDPFLGVARQAARRGLRALESVALVEVESRAGCKLLVRVCEVEDDPDRRKLRGPIPWPWWFGPVGYLVEPCMLHPRFGRLSDGTVGGPRCVSSRSMNGPTSPWVARPLDLD